MEPDHSRKVGEQRSTPKGTALEGTNRETFWRITPHGDQRIRSDDSSLEDHLESLNQKFAEHKSYLAKLTTSGGYVEYFIGWFGGSNLMATLSPKFMAETASLGIAIGFDIYLDDRIESEEESSEADEKMR